MLKLIDVDAAGRAYNLGDTAARLRYRNGYSHPEFMHAGQVYSVALSGLVTATDMLPGHRLRVELASSNFPNYERNLNSGGNISMKRRSIRHETESCTAPIKPPSLNSTCYRIEAHHA